MYLYVLTNNNDEYVTPQFPGTPFVTQCAGFEVTPTPFFTNEDAYKLLQAMEAPGIDDIKLDIVEVNLYRPKTR